MGDLNGDRVIFTNADFLKFQNSKDAILTALHIFFKNNPNYVLDFYGDPFPEMHSLPFLHFTNRMSYGEYLRSVIAGRYKFAITPLGAEEDGEAIEFNLCKNPFKYINYGLCKVPGIYSNSQLYTQCVNNYENGLIVKNTSDDWGNALQQMAEDGGLRNSISENAYCDVVKNYHVKNAAAILFELLS
jgi:glycosyltransferase involved in cell wall biosynthesis